MGGGLSSSAALIVALLRALRLRFELPLDDLSIARLAQRVENEFVGAHVGIMDPMASSLGREGCALWFRTRDLHYRHVPLPKSIQMVVVDSGLPHRHADGTRQATCTRRVIVYRLPFESRGWSLP